MLIAGAGNILRRDDGVGCKIIQLLQKSQSVPFVTLLDIGTNGFILLDIIENYSKVIIVDAADMGCDPGTVRFFSAPNAKMLIRSDALSTHGFGLIEIISLIEKLKLTTKLYILGIQPADITLGEGLTLAIQDAMPKVITLLRENIHA